MKTLLQLEQELIALFIKERKSILKRIEKMYFGGMLDLIYRRADISTDFEKYDVRIKFEVSMRSRDPKSIANAKAVYGDLRSLAVEEQEFTFSIDGTLEFRDCYTRYNYRPDLDMFWNPISFPDR